jgi:hypothetical protein
MNGAKPPKTPYIISIVHPKDNFCSEEMIYCKNTPISVTALEQVQ